MVKIKQMICLVIALCILLLGCGGKTQSIGQWDEVESSEESSREEVFETNSSSTESSFYTDSPPTSSSEAPKFTFENNVNVIDILWNNTVDYSTPQVIDIADMVVWGEELYEFRFEDTVVFYNRINLETLEQVTGGKLYDFGDTVHEIWTMKDRVIVHAGERLYSFGTDLEPIKNIFWRNNYLGECMAIPNRDLTKLVYAYEFDVYMVDLADESRERVIYTTEDRADRDEIFRERPVLEYFFDDGRIWLGLFEWEVISRYLLLDIDGNIIDEAPFFVGWEHSGGMLYTNEYGAIHIDEGHRYYNFERQEIIETDFENFQSSGIMARYAWWQPHVWYFSVPTSNATEQTSTLFYKIDYEKGILEEFSIPFDEKGSYLMGVTDGGRMLFLYKDGKGTVGYFVYDTAR